MVLLRVEPARQLLHAPANHLTSMTWHPLKRSTLRRSPERVRTCLITMVYESGAASKLILNLF